MADQQKAPADPDLSKGVATSEFSNTMLLGHVGDRPDGHVETELVEPV